MVALSLFVIVVIILIAVDVDVVYYVGVHDVVVVSDVAVRCVCCVVVLLCCVW